MPLVFDPKAPSFDYLKYSAAHVQHMIIDLASERIVATVIYGNIVDNKFKQNKSVPARRYVLESDVFNRIAAKMPDGTKNMYDNIKETIWEELVLLGAEAGTVV